MISVACIALIAVLAGGPSFAQASKAPAPAAAHPAAKQAAQREGANAVVRSVFLATMDAEFRKMDADKDGTVTRAEIEGFERAVSLSKAQAKNRQMFAMLDTNGDGQLSASEFSRLVSPGRVDAAPVLARMDINRDQSISLVEYRTATLGNFDRMDADKDGIVTPAEMKARGVGR